MPVKKDKNGVEKIIELEFEPEVKISFDESKKEIDKTLRLIK